MRTFAMIAVLGLCAAVQAADEKAAETKKVEIDNLKSEVPATWEKQEPKNPQFRILQFRIPKAEGDARDAEFYVSKLAGGGSVEDNVKRWKNQFKDAEGGEITKTERDGLKIYTMEFSGTFIEKAFPMDTKGVEREKYKLLGAIVETSDAVLYLRATGPAKTLDAHKAGWQNMIKNLKP